MWFKAASVFQFLEDFCTSPEDLEETLATKAYTPVNRRQLLSYGWVPPLGDESDQLTHSANGFILLKAHREERILPSSVIADHMAERIKKLEKTLERKIRGKEKLEIRDNVVMELTPQAFTKSSYEQVLIMPKDGLMVIDSASAKRVDQCTALLRDTIGSLPVAPVQTEIGQAGLFTRWLKGTRRLPDDLVMGDECVLQDEDNIAGTVRCNKQDLTSDEIRALSTTGKHVQRLGLTLNESINFVLDDEFVFTKIKFVETSPEDGSDVSDLDSRAIFDNNFVLMALEFSKFFPRMIEIFGGYKPSTDL